MGFEWSVEAGTAGTGDAAREFLVAVAFSWGQALSLEPVFERGSGAFVRYGHTPGKRVGPRRASATLEVPLRAIKETHPPSFLPQDLLGS
jgi:hypothetical protein